MNKKPIQVLVIPSQYPHQHNPIGGIFVRDYALAASTEADVRIASIISDPQLSNQLWKQEFEEDSGLYIGRIWLKQPFPLTHLKPIWYAYYLQIVPSLVERLWQDWRPQIIHAHTAFPGGLLARKLSQRWQIPYILTEHTGPFAKIMKPRLRGLLIYKVINQAAKVLTVSNYQRRSIEACRIPGDFHVLPNPVDVHEFTPTAEDPTPKKMIFVGRLVPGKGLDLLLKALSLFEDEEWQLDIVGDGDCRAEYEQLASELHIQHRVHFLGSRPKKALPALIRQAELLILPSLQETFGIVLVEAFACGRPVIATRCGGPEEFVKSEVGILAEPGQIESLISALREYSQKRHQYNPQICANYAYTHFSYEIVGTELNKLYHSIVNA